MALNAEALSGAAPITDGGETARPLCDTEDPDLQMLAALGAGMEIPIFAPQKSEPEQDGALFPGSPTHHPPKHLSPKRTGVGTGGG
jgi:hypothetical protein